MVPTVTFHGGNVLPNVEAQALYLGSDWTTNSTMHNQAQQFDKFLSTIVNSNYMDMLSQANYNVYRGSATAGAFDPAMLPSTLDDSTIRNMLANDVNNGTLQPMDGCRLYFVFVEDNVLVTKTGLGNSKTGFEGYHTAFLDGCPIRYAVIPFHGGVNAISPGMSIFDSMTEAASHELAEAVTDPDAGLSTPGWYDDTFQVPGAMTPGAEIGDVVAHQDVYLNGFRVQRICDQNDFAMTPMGATANPQDGVTGGLPTFALLQSGDLMEFNTRRGSASLVASNVARISDQGIDNNAFAMIDVIFTSGLAAEYHDDNSWQLLASGGATTPGPHVVDAKAGEGVSYVLFSDGSVKELTDFTGKFTTIAKGGIAAIDAGTDRFNVNMVDVVTTGGQGIEISDTSGMHVINTQVAQLSAGRGGFSAELGWDGYVFQYNDSLEHETEIYETPQVALSGISQVAEGTDPSGQPMMVAVTKFGSSYEVRNGHVSLFVSGVGSVCKPRDGVVDVVFTNGDVQEYLLGALQSVVTHKAKMVA
jgi:hypothetical protein